MSAETLLEQYLLSFHKARVVAYLDDHPSHVEEAVVLAISDKQPYSWRAAWVLCTYIQDNDPQVKKYLNKMIHTLPNKADGYQRELLKVINHMQLNRKQEGVLFNHCVTIWESVNKQPSVRYYALLTLLKITKNYPELKQEIDLLTQSHYLETLTPGVRKSVVKLLKKSQ
jgi:hypothetical protein